MEEQKHCPFCGSKARTKMFLKDNEERYFCECWLCSCRTQDFDTEEKAIKTWNERAINAGDKISRKEIMRLLKKRPP